MEDGVVSFILIGKINQKFHATNLVFYSEFVKFRFSYDDAHAAATASVAQVLPVVLMPFLGVCVDRFGKRTWMSKFLIHTTSVNLTCIYSGW